MPGTTFDVEVIEAGRGAAIRFPRGGTVFTEGERADCAYIVKRGRVEIRQADRAVDTIVPGEIFGHMALIDEEPRDASAIAVGDAEVVAIERPIFRELLRDDSDFALAVMRLTARHLRAAMKLVAA